jgi:hypothetical protein
LVPSLSSAGYQPEQVDRVLVTHLRGLRHRPCCGCDYTESVAAHACARGCLDSGTPHALSWYWPPAQRGERLCLGASDIQRSMDRTIKATCHAPHSNLAQMPTFV